ncbi:MAG TPA: RHS repeat-associated core domain-containing protein, partial [Prolixibacteraceae bacterium]|nr:RHS repeat-associated core domain-containing protein [Prolixibacteraceae bacterium]
LFTYDGLNRLDKAEYSEFDQLRQLITAREGFFNEDPGYDLNGNIVTLLRKGSTDALGTQGDIIDNLAYTYKTNSNQLQKVTDGVAGSLAHNKHFINASTSDYAYDQNGNATFVPNKRDTIRYNYLNLPEKMTIVGQGTISYLYDASGNKLKKSYDPLTGPTVDSYYQGSVLLTGGKVMVMNGEGRSVKNSTSWDYEYDLKDHLGNTRISFLADNGQVSVLQVKDYYPFGMEMTNGQSIAGDPTKYLYNGKELQDEAGLDFYDYGARFYDPVVGRWHSVDLLADKYYALSPYVYVADNPLKFIDPDGKKIIIAGSPEFQGATFKAMQKLSSSNLVMLKSGQIVEASNYKGAKSNIAFTGTGTGKKDFGTSLIHDLSSNQKHTVTVTPGSEANNTNDFTPTVRNYSNAHNPEKGDGGTIRFDPESTGSGIVNKDGSTGVDGSIILGHELIHADKAMNGKTLNRENNISDPASPSNWPQDISKEEVDTRKKENILRQESNIKKERLTP